MENITTGQKKKKKKKKGGGGGGVGVSSVELYYKTKPVGLCTKQKVCKCPPMPA